MCHFCASLFQAAALDHAGVEFEVVAGGWRGNGAYYRGRPADLRKHRSFHAFNARIAACGRVEMVDVTAAAWSPPTLVWGWAEDVEIENPGRLWMPRADTTQLLDRVVSDRAGWHTVSEKYVGPYLERGGPDGLPGLEELRARGKRIARARGGEDASAVQRVAYQRAHRKARA